MAETEDCVDTEDCVVLPPSTRTGYGDALTMRISKALQRTRDHAKKLLGLALTFPLMLLGGLMAGCSADGPTYFIISNQRAEQIHVTELDLDGTLPLSVDIPSAGSTKVDVSSALHSTAGSNCKLLQINCGMTDMTDRLCYRYTSSAGGSTSECASIDYCWAAFGGASDGKVLNISCDKNNPFTLTVRPDGTVG